MLKCGRPSRVRFSFESVCRVCKKLDLNFGRKYGLEKVAMHLQNREAFWHSMKNDGQKNLICFYVYFRENLNFKLCVLARRFGSLEKE